MVPDQSISINGELIGDPAPLPSFLHSCHMWTHMWTLTGWEGDKGRALVYRYVWRDDASVTSDESVRERSLWDASHCSKSLCLVLKRYCPRPVIRLDPFGIPVTKVPS